MKNIQSNFEGLNFYWVLIVRETSDKKLPVSCSELHISLIYFFWIFTRNIFSVKLQYNVHHLKYKDLKR